MSAQTKPAPRRHRRIGFTLALALIAGVLVLALWRKNSVPPPAVSTAGLDPAVAQLIQSNLAVVRHSPRSGDAWGRLGSTLMHYEFADEARQCFARAQALAPSDARWPCLQGVLMLQRDPRAALVPLRRATELSGSQPDAPRLRLAQVLAELGEHAEAEAQFQALLRAAPGHPPAQLGLARLRQAQGQSAASTNLLPGCLADPHTAKAAAALLAATLHSLGDTTGARAAARRSADAPADAPWPDPFWTEALAFRVGRRALIEDASALLDQGRPDESLRTLAAVTRDYPEDGEGWYLTGWAWNQMRRSAEAERALREHLRREPQSPKGHSQLAIALLGQRRTAEAVEILEAALKLKPTWRELHFNLGYARVQLGRDAEALAALRAALALDPNHVPTYTALAEVLARRGDREEALRLARQAEELSPGDPRVAALRQRLGPAR